MNIILYNENNNLRKVILNLLEWDNSKLESLLEFREFIKYYKNININNDKFDILTFTIENIKKENEAIKYVIKLIIENFEYMTLNYSIKINKYYKTPLYSAIINNKLKIAEYLINKGSSIDYVNKENLDIIDYIGKYCIKKINNPMIFKFILNNYHTKLREKYNEKFESDIIEKKEKEILNKIKYIIPDLIINRKYKLMTEIIKFYSFDYNYSYIIELILKGKCKTSLSTKDIQIIYNRRKLKFKIKPSYYEHTLNSYREIAVKNIDQKPIFNYRMFNLLIRNDYREIKEITILLDKTEIFNAIINDTKYNIKTENKINLFRRLLFLKLNNNSYEFFENILKDISESKKKWVIEKILEVLSNSKSIIEKINFKDILYIYEKEMNLQYDIILLNFLFNFHYFDSRKLEFQDFILSVLQKIADELMIIILDYTLYTGTTCNNKSIIEMSLSLENILKLIIEKGKSISFGIEDLLYKLCEMEKLNILIFIMKTLKKKIHLNITNLLLRLINNKNCNRKNITTLIYCLFSNKIISLLDIDLDRISNEMVDNTILCVNDKDEFVQTTKYFYLRQEENSKKLNKITNNDKDKIRKTGKTNYLNSPNSVDHSYKNKIDSNDDLLDIDISDVDNRISHDFINRDKIMNYDLNLMLIKFIKTNNLKEIENLLRNTQTKNQIDFNNNNNKITGWEYPLVLSYKICKTIQLNDKIKMDMEGNEIKIFKILLKHGADINVRIKNNVTILEDSLNNGIHNVNKAIFNYLIKENERNDTVSYNYSKQFNGHDNYKRHGISRERKQIENTDNDSYCKRMKCISQISRKRKYHENTNNDTNYKRMKYISRKVLKKVECKFDSFIYSYLFDINFNIEKSINERNVNTTDCYGNTILYYAFLKYDRESIKYLISIYSDIIINESLNENILDLSLLFNCTEIFLDVVQNERSIEFAFNYKLNISDLFKSIIYNSKISLSNKKRMIDKLCSIKSIGHWDLDDLLVMAMSISSYYECKSMLYYLLEKGSKGEQYKKSLLYAVENEKENILLLLLQKRGYSHFKCSMGYAIQVAIKKEKVSILKILLKYFKGNINRFYSIDCYPLLEAIYKNNFSMVQLLVKNGSNVNISIYNKLSILYYAFTKENPDENVIEFLINCGATINISNEEQFKKLFDKMEKRKSLHILKYCLKINDNEFINNLLKFSIILKCHKILNILITNNLNMEIKINDENVKNNKKLTLWKFANCINDTKTSKFLVKSRSQIVKAKKKKDRKNKLIKKSISISNKKRT
ncbi:hypothetical protein PIROE2DRAFT_6153 [Piromyces sp. E2]|nr:hypothetical protein PIROE2DRAFT_6153 [Piromyces sp. E2]|eukprot:OUM66622.1 hypothetical protein PIROE2DRAFT_6153 [Piromyces sp. E2]